MAEHQPPHSNQAEQGLLGLLLMYNRAFDEAAAIVSADDFYAAEHRAIFSTIAALVGRQRTADVITVHDAGGHDLPYLNELATSGFGGDEAARTYAQIIRERAQRRELVAIASSMRDAALLGGEHGADVIGIAEKAASRLMALQSSGQKWEPQLVATMLPRFIDQLSERYSGAVQTMPSGMVDLDRVLGGGFRRKELNVLGARPGMGKSAMTLTVILAAARKFRVLLCSQEDSEEMLLMRLVANAGAINMADLRTPVNAPETMWSSVNDGIAALEPLQLCIDTQAGLSARDVRRKMMQARQRMGGVDLVIVDYLQLMGSGREDASSRAENRNRELGDVLISFKGMLKEFDACGLMLSQLTRAAEEYDGPPRIEHLRDSGEIEQVAENILLLWRQAKRNPTPENKHWAHLEVAKQKHGPTDAVHLYFDGATQRFSPWDGPVPWKKSGRGG